MLPIMAAAQGPWNDPPRREDHFWRRRVLMRIDLKEKINRPLIRNEVRESGPMYAPSTSEYGNRRGVVRALLDGLQDLKYSGYVPDSLDAPRTYDEVIGELRRLVGGAANQQNTEGGGETAPTEGGGEDPFGGGGDDFGDFGGDDFGFGGEDFEGGGEIEDVAGGGETANAADLEDLLAGVNTIMEIVEDRIFDRNKSDMYYDIHYVRIIWVDPEGIYPYDVPLVSLRYEDVLDVLQDTQWKNWYNDSENRSMKEVFELRLFHGFIVDVSGAGSRTTDEAEKRRQQMIEFEHHLWEF
jgi:hypothetical protein